MTTIDRLLELRALMDEASIGHVKVCTGTGIRDGTGVCDCGAIYDTEADGVAVEVPFYNENHEYPNELAPTKEGQVAIAKYVEALLNEAPNMIQTLIDQHTACKNVSE